MKATIIAGFVINILELSIAENAQHLINQRMLSISRYS